MATIAEIQTWLADHPGASDVDIATAMNTYGVTVGQLSQASGLAYDAVAARYNVAMAGSNLPTSQTKAPPSPTSGNLTNPTGTVTDPYLAAYYASDYARLNQLISQGGLTAGQAAARYNLTADQLQTMQASGIKFAQAGAGVSPLVLAAAAAAAFFLLG